jgi:hypothetical protein
MDVLTIHLRSSSAAVQNPSPVSNKCFTRETISGKRIVSSQLLASFSLVEISFPTPSHTPLSTFWARDERAHHPPTFIERRCAESITWFKQMFYPGNDNRETNCLVATPCIIFPCGDFVSPPPHTPPSTFWARDERAHHQPTLVECCPESISCFKQMFYPGNDIRETNCLVATPCIFSPCGHFVSPPPHTRPFDLFKAGRILPTARGKQHRPS